MSALMNIEHVDFTYSDGSRALKNVTLDIYSGEKLAVLGANGAGKSTLFLNMNGILRPSSGKIFFKGAPVAYDKKSLIRLRKNIGIVFQDPDQQMFASTVMGEISFGALNLGMSKEEAARRVKMLAKQLGLTSLLQKPPHFLSGGQKKLVSIADVLIMEPEIIIFDEPMAALDPVNTDRIREILEQLTAEGKTIVLSTHDVDFAFEWADRIAVFSDGNLIQTGTPKEVFANRAVLEQGNLKMPAVLQIFQSLCAQGYFEQGMVCPSTAAALVQMISEKKTTER